jgi:bifunctional ADP-heptose synthase (sugar kinase/adenylyltransferase)
VLVCDYGHGLLSDKTIGYLNKVKKFLSLNVQLNSSNIGTHSLKKYNNIDLLIINESEMRFELKNEYEDIKIIAKRYFKNKKLKNLVITRGLNGALLIDKKNIYECPAFAFKSIDKVGAGDAMFSIISLCLKKDLDKNLSLFLGSLAAAFSVQSIGNKKIFNFSELENYLEYSLK